MYKHIIILSHSSKIRHGTCTVQMMLQKTALRVSAYRLDPCRPSAERCRHASLVSFASFRKNTGRYERSCLCMRTPAILASCPTQSVQCSMLLYQINMSGVSTKCTGKIRPYTVSLGSERKEQSEIGKKLKQHWKNAVNSKGRFDDSWSEGVHSDLRPGCKDWNPESKCSPKMVELFSMNMCIYH